MWTVKRIEDLCIEYCNRCGVTFNSSVAINGRLKTTLGRCFYEEVGSVYNPTKIEISRHLLETATEECIKNVIAHECAHYVAAAITHEAHGHDKVFKRYCAMIGIENDTRVYHNLVHTKSNEEIYKYTLYCEKCGGFVGGRHRACKITKSPEDFFTNCCRANIKVYQNW